MRKNQEIILKFVLTIILNKLFLYNNQRLRKESSIYKKEPFHRISLDRLCRNNSAKLI